MNTKRVSAIISLFTIFGHLAFAQTDSIDISISLDGPQAGVASSAVGSELGSGANGCYYVFSTKTLYVKIQYSGLSSNSTAAHIHGPAVSGVNASVVQNLTGFVTGTTSGTYSSSFVLSGTNETRLLNDSLYINIHTSSFPSGEIRGQLINTNTYLPVELTSFNAFVNGRSVELVWKTATEINNHGFDIEKYDRSAWRTIGFVRGNGTINTPQTYSFVDPSAKGRVLYRLKQIDRDGKFEYSSVVEAAVALTAGDYSLTQNYPNPFNPSTSFTFAVQNQEQVNVSVYNALGQEVATLFNGIAAPNELYTLTFNAKDLSSGTYFYALRSATRNEVRKMSLVK